MSDDPDIKAEHGIATATLRAFWNWCVMVEETGNTGHYGATIAVNGMRTPIRDVIPVPLREGVIYFSRGHGWRVRKNPHWRVRFQQLFPIHYARFAQVSE